MITPGDIVIPVYFNPATSTTTERVTIRTRDCWKLLTIGALDCMLFTIGSAAKRCGVIATSNDG